MKDSIGGVPALAMVFVFIIIISGYLAFTINYSKAFKMKSAIVDILQESDNLKNSNGINDGIRNEIKKQMNSIGYSASQEFIANNCPSPWKHDNELGFCYNVEDVEGDYTTRYIKIKTFVSIDVPIINRVLPNIRFFTVEGSTKSSRYDSNEK